MPAERSPRVKESLGARLLLWLAPSVLAVLAASLFASHAVTLRFANEAYDEGLYDSARALAQQIRLDAAGRPVLELPRAAEEIIEFDPFDRIFYRVLSPQGVTVAGRDDLPAPAAMPAKPPSPVRFYDAEVGGEPVRAGAYTLFDSEGVPRAHVLVAETLVKRRTLLRNLLLTELISIIAITLAMAATIWFGIRHGLSPLRELAAALSRRGWDDLSPINDREAPQEVRPLTRAINDMMKRLETSLTAQRRFIAEAAHQLRTPLAGLTAQADRALLARDIDTIKPALEQLQLASSRVTRLVNQILTLARAEPGHDPAREFVVLDLAKLVQQACREWVPQALARRVDLGYEGESGPVMIRGDELLLSEMLNNLIDNALRYGAAPGGRVTVRLAALPRIELAVEDDGPGIPEDERAHIFDRFHRLPGSAPGGCGLGLAIVREIARAHGAEARAEPKGPEGGAVFRVVFADGQSAPA
jgi:two-component system sensor histidine kinase TctE